MTPKKNEAADLVEQNFGDQRDIFTRLYEIDVSPYIQTMTFNGRSSDYLEWATAWRLVREAFPSAHYEVHWFKEDENLVPYLHTKVGFFVQVTVTIEERKETDLYPIDENEVAAFDVAVAHQRALVKCLGRHGFALKLWERTERDEMKRQKGVSPAKAPLGSALTISEPQAKRLFAIAKSNEWTEEAMKKYILALGYKTSLEIKRADYDKIVSHFEKKPARDPSEPPAADDEYDYWEGKSS